MRNRVRIHTWLYPASWLYGIAVWIRNKCFDWGILKEHSFNVPIINVGNITVGGTGKTPHTEYLLKLLCDNGYQTAVLSRGYKRESKGFVLAKPSSTAHTLGDEPYQIMRKFPQTYVAVDADRCHGIQQLCNRQVIPPADVVVLDDAYQHRHVKPGMNILLVNYNRIITEDALLPAGRLREHASGKARADIVVVTKCPQNLSFPECRSVEAQLNLFAFQKLYFTTYQYTEIYPLFDEGKTMPLPSIVHNMHVILLTGIASPVLLRLHFREKTRYVYNLTYADHHDFTVEDLEKTTQCFMQLPEGQRLIVVTEKDAARLVNHPDLPDCLKPYIYVQPIEVRFLNNSTNAFNQIILKYVRKNLRNC